MLQSRNFNVVLVSSENPASIDTEVAGKAVAYDGNEVKLSL